MARKKFSQESVCVEFSFKGAAKSNFTSIFHMQTKFIFLNFFLRLILEFFDLYIERYLHFFFPLFIVFPFTLKKKLNSIVGVAVLCCYHNDASQAVFKLR